MATRIVRSECKPPGTMLKTVKPGEADPLLPTPVKDCVLLSAGKRYDELVRRAEAMQANSTPTALGI